jgi:hypothetical protein
MDSARLKEILLTFTDNRDALILERGRLVIQVHGDLIEAETKMRDGYLIIAENGKEWSAVNWIVHRIARLDLLAQRVITTFPRNPVFLTPRAEVLDEMERAPNDAATVAVDALGTVRSLLERRPAGSCSVQYLTSDAGEGKTTIINQLANDQAQDFLGRKTDWLLIPIALGGRPFLRFDDVVAAALMNQLRFPHLYFDSFIQLVRLGMLVPALDGFEEIFVETQEGDAVSSLGTLIRQMHGEGTLLIAARKAYFEFKGLETQARLIDTLPDADVSFSRVKLQRWDEEEFLRYCELSGVTDPVDLYREVRSL